MRSWVGLNIGFHSFLLIFKVQDIKDADQV